MRCYKLMILEVDYLLLIFTDCRYGALESYQNSMEKLNSYFSQLLCHYLLVYLELLQVDNMSATKII